jgi:hypothetical protein
MLSLDRGIVMHGGADSFPLSKSIDALSCTLLARPDELLKALRRPLAHGTQPKMIR